MNLLNSQYRENENILSMSRVNSVIGRVVNGWPTATVPRAARQHLWRSRSWSTSLGTGMRHEPTGWQPRRTGADESGPQL